jgi:predicted nucleic acid-binding protein
VEVRFVLDTNRLTDFLRGVADAVDKVQLAERIFVPVIVLGEMRGGFLVGRSAAANEARLMQFLDSRRVAVLAVDGPTSFHYARIFAGLRKRGTPIPQNDLWIAALAAQHALPLYSRDAHFRHLPELRLL